MRATLGSTQSPLLTAGDYVNCAAGHPPQSTILTVSRWYPASLLPSLQQKSLYASESHPSHQGRHRPPICSHFYQAVKSKKLLNCSQNQCPRNHKGSFKAARGPPNPCTFCAPCPVLAVAHRALQDILAIPRAVGRLSLQVMKPAAALQVAVGLGITHSCSW